MNPLRPRSTLAAIGLAALLAGCAVEEAARPPDPATVRARLMKLLPPGTGDAAGWASDIQTSFSLLGLEQARAHAEELRMQAHAALACSGLTDTRALAALADMVVQRNY